MTAMLLSYLHSLCSNVHNCPLRVPYRNSSLVQDLSKGHGALSLHVTGEITGQQTGVGLRPAPRDSLSSPPVVSLPAFTSALGSVVELLGGLETIFPRKSTGDNFPAHVTDLTSRSPQACRKARSLGADGQAGACRVRGDGQGLVVSLVCWEYGAEHLLCGPYWVSGTPSLGLRDFIIW